MSDIAPFVFDGQKFRAISVDGQPWFVAADAARILGYSATAALTRTLDDDEKGVQNLHTLGGEQAQTIITESGLYSAILRSRVEGAKRFKRWVTHEVLPAIRQHGGYLTPEKTEQILSDPDTIIRLATDLKAERARRLEMQAKVDADAPKVLFADAVSASNSTILIGELAKILRGNGVEIGQNRLFARLREDGYLIRREGSDYNTPTQKAMELGLFRVKETAVTHSDGHVTISKTTKVTGKGQQYFTRRFLGQHPDSADHVKPDLRVVTPA